MFKRELFKIGIAGLIGLIIGGVYGISNSIWSMIILGPFYVIGLLYGGKYLIQWAGKAIGSWFSGIFQGGLKGFLVKSIMLLIGIFALLLFCWIIGCVLAGRALFIAKGQDMSLGYNENRTTGVGNRGGVNPRMTERNDFDTWGSKKTSNSGKTNAGSLPQGKSGDFDNDGFDF